MISDAELMSIMEDSEIISKGNDLHIAGVPLAIKCRLASIIEHCIAENVLSGDECTQLIAYAISKGYDDIKNKEV